MSDTIEPVAGQTAQEEKLPDSKGLGGRPPKLTVDETLEVYTAFKQYIVDNDDPTIVGFCAWDDTAIKYNITKDDIHNWQEFSELRKRAIAKQEANLLKQAGNGTYNPTLAIFRLKQPQHGYSDRRELTGADGKDLMQPQLTPEQAEQLLRLRAQRGDSTTG